MTITRDTDTALDLAPPRWFTALAWLLPAGIFAQFVSAGLGLFRDSGLLGLHAAMGFTLSLPVIGLLAGSLLVPRLRGFAWWAGAVLLAYSVQVVLAAGAGPLPMSFHPANGALLLTASLVLLARVERRHGRRQVAGPVL